MIRTLAVALLVAAPSSAETIAVAAGSDAQERLQTALIEAKPGDTVALGEGRFELSDGLSLDVAKVTVRGAGADKTVLSFKGQQGSGEGLLVTSDDVVLRDFAVEDAKGDGIKSKGADRIVYHRLRVEWTGGPRTSNGAYGIYPVESTDVLIDGCVVKGASDAGIYVGQAKNIVVRHNVATYNVAGIEIENSFNADVYRNSVQHNTGGVLVFDLPNLPQSGGHAIRVFENVIAENDTPNFAPKGNIVASVPMGTGVMVMANRDVHVFRNTLTGNATANVMLVAYRLPFEDAKYEPRIRDVMVRDNRHGRAGWNPQFKGGAELKAALGEVEVPIFWDGVGSNIRVTDKAKVITLGLKTPLSPLESAAPGSVDLSKGAAIAEPKAVMLPASMEAAVAETTRGPDAHIAPTGSGLPVL